jgi:TonB-dependent SusC/RagA subfamily outer membrane receptor
VLTREQIEGSRATTMEQLMSRRFNGVQVVRQDGELQLVIRGRAGPLIVVDGNPGMPLSAFWQLDPSDIEEIRVLRDSATAMYGIDGANGVVAVTTRRL